MSFKRAIKPLAGVVPPVPAIGVGPTSGFPSDPQPEVPSGPPKSSDLSSNGIPPEALRQQRPIDPALGVEYFRVDPTLGVEYFRVDPTLSEILNSLDPVQAVGSEPPAGMPPQRPPPRPVPIYAPGDSVSKAPSGMNLATTPSPSAPEHPAPGEDTNVIFS